MRIKYLLLSALPLVMICSFSGMFTACESIQTKKPTAEELQFREVSSLAEGGDASAQFRLSDFYLQGYGTDQNATAYQKWITASAESGYLSAQKKLANNLLEGEVVQRNVDSAIRWLERAAEQKDRQSQRKLVTLYTDGEHVPKNVQKAVQWTRPLAEQGDSSAIKRLATIYEAGEGIPKDIKESAVWHAKLAQRGDKVSQRKLAEWYEEGKGVEKNLEFAKKWWLRLASAKDLDAQLKAANSYERGLWGGNQKDAALRWYERAANNGSVKATLWLGTYYRGGKGSQLNLDKSINWFLKGVRAGSTEAKQSLYELEKEKYELIDWEEPIVFGQIKPNTRYIVESKYNITMHMKATVTAFGKSQTQTARGTGDAGGSYEVRRLTTQEKGDQKVEITNYNFKSKDPSVTIGKPKEPAPNGEWELRWEPNKKPLILINKNNKWVIENPIGMTARQKSGFETIFGGFLNRELTFPKGEHKIGKEWTLGGGSSKTMAMGAGLPNRRFRIVGVKPHQGDPCAMILISLNAGDSTGGATFSGTIFRSLKTQLVRKATMKGQMKTQKNQRQGSASVRAVVTADISFEVKESIVKD